jgi:DNA-nicking Smr family endonuclease
LQNLSAYEIVEFEKLIESLYVTRSLSNRTNELVSQTNHLREQNEVYSNLSNKTIQLYEKLIKAGYAKSDVDKKEIKKIKKKKINSKESASKNKKIYIQIIIF